MVRKLKDEIEQAFGFLTDVYALLMYEDMVNDDEDLSADKKAEKIAKKVKVTADNFAVSLSVTIPLHIDESAQWASRRLVPFP